MSLVLPSSCFSLFSFIFYSPPFSSSFPVLHSAPLRLPSVFSFFFTSSVVCPCTWQMSLVLSSFRYLSLYFISLILRVSHSAHSFPFSPHLSKVIFSSLINSIVFRFLACLRLHSLSFLLLFSISLLLSLSYSQLFFSPHHQNLSLMACLSLSDHNSLSIWITVMGLASPSYDQPSGASCLLATRQYLPNRIGWES